MKNAGIIEKSTVPSIGELIRIPFHVTCVCDGDVPRNATVESVARPCCLTKIEVLKVSTSAIDRAMFSWSTSVSSRVFCTPISFIVRRVTTGTSSIGSDHAGRSSCAAASSGRMSSGRSVRRRMGYSVSRSIRW